LEADCDAIIVSNDVNTTVSSLRFFTAHEKANTTPSPLYIQAQVSIYLPNESKISRKIKIWQTNTSRKFYLSLNWQSNKSHFDKFDGATFFMFRMKKEAVEYLNYIILTTTKETR
jgi:hypothetical protein